MLLEIRILSRAFWACSKLCSKHDCSKFCQPCVQRTVLQSTDAKNRTEEVWFLASLSCRGLFALDGPSRVSSPSSPSESPLGDEASPSRGEPALSTGSSSTCNRRRTPPQLETSASRSAASDSGAGSGGGGGGCACAAFPIGAIETTAGAVRDSVDEDEDDEEDCATGAVDAEAEVSWAATGCALGVGTIAASKARAFRERTAIRSATLPLIWGSEPDRLLQKKEDYTSLEILQTKSNQQITSTNQKYKICKLENKNLIPEREFNGSFNLRAEHLQLWHLLTQPLRKLIVTRTKLRA